MSEISIIDSEEIKSKIYTIRGIRVMFDSDLAEFYQVKTHRLNEQVRRNMDRFPSDFMFQLTKDELESYLRSQNAISNIGRGGRRYLPYVFTEFGVAMLSSVLKSKRANEINIIVIRAFVELRKIAPSTLEYESQPQIDNRIESRMETIEANHLVDHLLMSNKVTQLSKEVNEMREGFQHFSKVLDEFQNVHIIIKRPDEDKFEG